MPETLTIWRFTDGKPGHENQSLGLVKALADQAAVSVQDISVRKGWHNLFNWLLGRCPDRPQTRPDLLVGAGHATHLPLLACRRCCGGKALVLMKPSLPSAWFDFCIVPQHDGVAASEKVLLTQGVLNPVSVGEKRADAPVLILLGGPSAEYAWDEQGLVEQIAALTRSGETDYLVAGSRRTPATTIQRLRSIAGPTVKVLAQEDTEPGWLTSVLAGTREAWITEDSVSMVYEALTAGAACGLLTVPLKKPGRVAQGVKSLVRDGVVTTFESFQQGRALCKPETPFNEATRAAQWVLAHV